MNYANIFAKKCQIFSFIDHIWAIDNKKRLSVRVFFVVPRAGVEPARIAPLVFETSASTDSAIWARVRQIVLPDVAVRH